MTLSARYHSRPALVAAPTSLATISLAINTRSGRLTYQRRVPAKSTIHATYSTKAPLESSHSTPANSDTPGAGHIAPIDTIFVGRLTPDVDEAWLRLEFERFGEIVGTRIPRYYRESGASRGVGFVEFASPESVERAVQYDGEIVIDGHVVNIDRDTRRRPKRFRRVDNPTSDARSPGTDVQDS
ncbi:hypothetical protein PENSPDRAFT_686836 [Peniophora sp. CONT]|nr:hypothetical protein PENSPDRAFT_686836 [Peniophora sp. CONT]